MQRLCAYLLLFAISLPLIPRLAASPQQEPALPACCHRDGKHACASKARRHTASTTAGPELFSLKAKCSQFPNGRSTSAEDRWAAEPPAAGYVVYSSHAAWRPAPGATLRLALSILSIPKRGPPAARS